MGAAAFAGRCVATIFFLNMSVIALAQAEDFGLDVLPARSGNAGSAVVFGGYGPGLIYGTNLAVPGDPRTFTVQARFKF